MTEADLENVHSARPWGGAIQGSVQALVMAVFMWMGRGPALYAVTARQSTLGFFFALAATAVLLIGLGAIVDRRRRDRSLPLVGPLMLRGLILLLLVLGFGACAAGYEIPPGAGVTSFLICSPLIFVVVDRVLSPAWVLGATIVEQRARRRWDEREVVEVDGTRALLREETGTTEWVRSEQPLELGPVYVVLTPIEAPASPYRTDEARLLVHRAESAEARATRRSAIVTAALGLLSGLAWLTLPFFLVVGSALSKPG